MTVTLFAPFLIGVQADSGRELIAQKRGGFSWFWLFWLCCWPFRKAASFWLRAAASAAVRAGAIPTKLAERRDRQDGSHGYLEQHGWNEPLMPRSTRPH